MKRRVTQPFALWFTGLPSAGKTTLADAVGSVLSTLSVEAVRLDGDAFRKNVTSGLGYSRADREANIRRISDEAARVTREGAVALVSVISPYRSMRAQARRLIETFVEIYVRCPIEVCESRDVKGFYKKARAGMLTNFTGVSDPYEEPLSPELTLDTHLKRVDECVGAVIAYLNERRFLS